MISDRDLEQAVLEIMSSPDAPLLTPGVVYRHLQKRMNCCGCAPLAIETIYAKLAELEAAGKVCTCACGTVRTKMLSISSRPVRRPDRTPANDSETVTIAVPARRSAKV